MNQLITNNFPAAFLLATIIMLCVTGVGPGMLCVAYLEWRQRRQDRLVELPAKKPAQPAERPDRRAA